MTYDIDAIFEQGVFRPLEPVLIPAGTRVHLSVNREVASIEIAGRLRSPRLANPEQAADFQMEVRQMEVRENADTSV